MKYFLSTLLLLLLLPLTLPAQSAGFRAQGRYYSAKEAFEAGKFSEAATLLKESREFLSGKSNVRLQYLLVRSLYSAGKFTEAQQEMARFFEITDAKGEAREKIYQNYPQDVDQLTSDETREISIMIDKIDREVANNTEARVAAEKNAAAQAAAREKLFSEMRALVVSRYISEGTPFPGSNGWTEETTEVSLSGSFRSATLTMRSRSDHVQPRKPMLRAERRATFDLANLLEVTFVRANPSPGRSSNGRPFTIGPTIEGMEHIRGLANGQTLVAKLRFRANFSVSNQNNYRDEDGLTSAGHRDPWSYSIQTIAFPITNEAAFREVVAALKAIR